jgi:hypothetical protein
VACNAGVSAQDNALARGRLPAALGIMHRSFVVPMGEGPRGAASSNDQSKRATGTGCRLRQPPFGSEPRDVQAGLIAARRVLPRLATRRLGYQELAWWA